MVCKFLLNFETDCVVVKEWRHFKLLKWKCLLFKMAPSPWQQLTKTGLTKTALTKTALTKTCVCVRIGTITLEISFGWDQPKLPPRWLFLKHKDRGNRWIVIDGNVYDITQWQHKHPGGAKILGHYAGRMHRWKLFFFSFFVMWYTGRARLIRTLLIRSLMVNYFLLHSYHLMFKMHS